MRVLVSCFVFFFSVSSFAERAPPCLVARAGPPSGPLEALVAVDGTDPALIGVVGDVVLRSGDEGRTWNVVADLPRGDESAGVLAATLANRVVIIARGSLLRSESSGRSFESYELPAIEGAQAMALADDGRSIFVAYQGGVARLISSAEGLSLDGIEPLDASIIDMVVRDGRVIAASEGRVLTRRREGFSPRRWDEVALPLGTRVISMAQDGRGVLWAATDSGLVRLGLDGTLQRVLPRIWREGNVFLTTGSEGELLVVERGEIRRFSHSCSGHRPRVETPTLGSPPSRRLRRGAVRGALPTVTLELVLGARRQGVFVMLSWPLPRPSATGTRDLRRLEMEAAREREDVFRGREEAVDLRGVRGGSFPVAGPSGSSESVTSVVEALWSRAVFDIWMHGEP